MMKRRWLLRSGVTAVLAAPTLILFTYGCDSPTQFDDLCGWLADPENCYREFFIDVGARCGSAETKPGQFLARDKLDICILTEGGQVLFNPPLDLAAPPPNNPDPIEMKFINSDATECGKALFVAKYDFTLTINGDTPPDGEPLPDSAVAGGTFSMTGGKSTDILSVTCPAGGGAYTFDRLQLKGPDGQGCPQFEDILPHAEIDFNPGGIDQLGVVRLFVYFPPQEGELADATPVPVNYFECIIPAAPPPCANGMKDGSESDIDCGGSFCVSKCEDSQSCISDDDCLSGVCNLVMGIKMCIGP